MCVITTDNELFGEGNMHTLAKKFSDTCEVPDRNWARMNNGIETSV